MGKWLERLRKAKRQDQKSGRQDQENPFPPGVGGSGLRAGAQIAWQGSDGHVRGPAAVEIVTEYDGRTWAWVEHRGVGRWLNEKIILPELPAGLAENVDFGVLINDRPPLPETCQLCDAQALLVWSVPQQVWVCFWCFDNTKPAKEP